TCALPISDLEGEHVPGDVRLERAERERVARRGVRAHADLRLDEREVAEVALGDRPEEEVRHVVEVPVRLHRGHRRGAQPEREDDRDDRQTPAQQAVEAFAPPVAGGHAPPQPSTTIAVSSTRSPPCRSRTASRTRSTIVGAPGPRPAASSAAACSSMTRWRPSSPRRSVPPSTVVSSTPSVYSTTRQRSP